MTQKKVKPVPEGYSTVTPYLVVKGAAKAIDFYKSAFGAKEVLRMDGPGGSIAHADLVIGTSHVMLADKPEKGEAKGTSASIFLYVENVDDLFRKALRAGAKETAAVKDMFWGDRYGKITDPFGQEWQIATHIEDVSPAEMEKRMAAATA
jgi:PhnB protein